MAWVRWLGSWCEMQPGQKDKNRTCKEPRKLALWERTKRQAGRQLHVIYPASKSKQAEERNMMAARDRKSVV